MVSWTLAEDTRLLETKDNLLLVAIAIANVSAFLLVSHFPQGSMKKEGQEMPT